MGTAIVSYLPAAALAERAEKKWFVLLTYLFFSLFPLAVFLSRSFPALVGAFALGGLREIGEPARKALIVDLSDPRARGRTVGLYYAIRGFSVAGAAAVGGALWTVKPSATFLVAARPGACRNGLDGALSSRAEGEVRNLTSPPRAGPASRWIMLAPPMRLPAALLLLSLLAAFHAPLVAAVSDSGMDCCAGGMMGICCPRAGSCSMRRCGSDAREALLSTMGVFLVPGPAAPVEPARSALVLPARVASPVSKAFRVPDPPPRG